jgi:hypothetical protein
MLLCAKIRLQVSAADANALEFMQGKCRGLYNWWVMRLRDGGERWPGWVEAKATLEASKDHDPELRVGRRIEVLCAPGARSPWRRDFLCINPTYPLPEEEFFAQLYLYVRDREDITFKVAAPQPWDQALGRTF